VQLLKRIYVWSLCAALLSVPCSYVSGSSTIATEEQVQGQWLRDAYSKALVSEMNIDSPPDDLFWRDDGYVWFVVIRILSSDHATPEFHFTLWRTADQKLHARVTRPRNSSIYNQLKVLHAGSRKSTPANLAASLSLSVIDLPDSKELRRLASEIETAQIQAVPPSDMIMDPITYEFRSVSRSRTTYVSTIAAPGHTKDDSFVVTLGDRLLQMYTKSPSR
jgi:hypothetical protein